MLFLFFPCSLILFCRFRPPIVKDVIHGILVEELGDKQYSVEESTDWSKKISDTIKTRLGELGYDRYKFIVQVAIGEQRGEGFKMGCRCFWDSDTDNYARDLYMNVGF